MAPVILPERGSVPDRSRLGRGAPQFPFASQHRFVDVHLRMKPSLVETLNQTKDGSGDGVRCFHL